MAIRWNRAILYKRRIPCADGENNGAGNSRFFDDERIRPLNSIQLEYFTAVARAGGFSAAARKLCLTQPALSRQIRLLEEELGVPLFLRQAHGIHLTKEGARLLSRAEEITRKIRNLPSELREVRRSSEAGSSSAASRPESSSRWATTAIRGVSRLRRYGHSSRSSGRNSGSIRPRMDRILPESGSGIL